ncbi:hypothetical protein PS645_03369 [Pseudomonas fluorescens]|jgi:hypothetical protein|uniref:Uncharacterized protein n=1 Tax=Pseudomonas fluorescens TaxID=294 RepID=A0A5E6UHD2_PSEFL|nr:hypothetical protein PS645_03369 [Pseudomonas fluorescens]
MIIALELNHNVLIGLMFFQRCSWDTEKTCCNRQQRMDS